VAAIVVAAATAMETAMATADGGDGGDGSSGNNGVDNRGRESDGCVGGGRGDDSNERR